MGVKKQWKVMKLRQLPMNEDTRRQLIKDIISHKQPSARLYAWDVHHEGVNLVAKQAFFNQQDTLKNWYIGNKLWEQESPPSGVVVYSWKTDVDNIVKHTKSASVREIQLPRKREMDVAILPSSTQEDIQQSLKKQG